MRGWILVLRRRRGWRMHCAGEADGGCVAQERQDGGCVGFPSDRTTNSTDIDESISVEFVVKSCTMSGRNPGLDVRQFCSP